MCNVCTEGIEGWMDRWMDGWMRMGVCMSVLCVCMYGCMRCVCEKKKQNTCVWGLYN